MIDENRFRQHDIGQMGAPTLVRVVADEHVSGLYIGLVVTLTDMLDQPQKTAQMHRNVLGLTQRVAVEVEQRGGTIPAFLDVGGVGRFDERFAHFFDDGRQGRADDLGGDGIDGVHGKFHFLDEIGQNHTASSTTFKYGSTRAAHPGGTTVVASICSITAGPANRFPARSRSRS